MATSVGPAVHPPTGTPTQPLAEPETVNVSTPSYSPSANGDTRKSAAALLEPAGMTTTAGPPPTISNVKSAPLPERAVSPAAPTCSTTRTSRELVLPPAKAAVTRTVAATPSGNGCAASVLSRTHPLGEGGAKEVAFGSRKVKSEPNVAPPGVPTRVKNTSCSPVGPPYPERWAVTVTSVAPASSSTTTGETRNITPRPHTAASRAPAGKPTRSTPDLSKPGNGPAKPLPHKPNRRNDPPPAGARRPHPAGTGPVRRLPPTSNVSNLSKAPNPAGGEPVSLLPDTSKYRRSDRASRPEGNGPDIPAPFKSKCSNPSNADGQVPTPKSHTRESVAGYKSGLPPASKWTNSPRPPQSPVGKPPVKRLSPNDNRCNPGKLPSQPGMEPVSRLPPTSRVCKLVKEAKAAGMRPSSRLGPKSNVCKLVKASKPVRPRPTLTPAGMFPDNRFPPRFSNFKSARPPSETGMGPRNRFPDKSR